MNAADVRAAIADVGRPLPKVIERASQIWVAINDATAQGKGSDEQIAIIATALGGERVRVNRGDYRCVSCGADFVDGCAHEVKR